MFYKNPYYDANKKHHTPTGFCNLEPFVINPIDFAKWRKQRKVIAPIGGYKAFIEKWFQTADFSAIENGIWWLGHASTLIKINQKTILTDPVFSKCVSPLRFIGPRRRTPCPTAVAQLPKIDVIVISHNHYDHLDYPTIKQLIKRFPDVIICVPLGLKPKLLSWGVNQVVELDWYDNLDISGLKLTAIPAHHWSRRAIFDTNRTLWCGWMMEYANRTIYFVGDTGYAKHFSELKQLFPNIDVALIPIGCYAPRWFMHNQHIDPQNALKIFKELACKRAIAIHWGAFELADDPLDEPPKILQSMSEPNLDDEQLFTILKIGEHISI